MSPHLILAAAIAGLSFGGGYWLSNTQHQAARTEALELEREARKAQDKLAERNDREFATALSRANARALDARTDSERMRNALDELAQSKVGAAPGSDAERFGRLAELLRESGGLVEEGGRRVEQLAQEKAALQRHITGE